MSGVGARCRDVCRGNFFRVVTSDVCNVAAIVLLLISVAVGTSKPTDNFSWAKCQIPASDGSAPIYVNFGLTTYVQCYGGSCQSFDLGNIQNSHCKVGGQGVIAAATFAMLFGLISIFLLHVDVAGKQFCGRRVPYPRLMLYLFSFLSLLLYIVVVATWYNQCFNGVGDIKWGDQLQYGTSNAVAGYAVATAIAAIVFSWLGWSFSFWRTCSPNKNEPVRQPAVKAPKADGGAAAATAPGGPMSPNGSSVPYTQQASSSDLGKAAGDEQGGAYGGAYGNGAAAADESYSNDATAGGYTSGGYGGAYGGGSGGGAYGGNDSGGAYGGSSGGGAYGSSKPESAYGY